jgi:hypothetical protein
MEAVKREYRNRYEMLCVRRMGDEVREVRRVEEYSERRVERH